MNFDRGKRHHEMVWFHRFELSLQWIQSALMSFRPIKKDIHHSIASIERHTDNGLESLRLLLRCMYLAINRDAVL